MAVIPLRPAPQGHHPDCGQGCRGATWLAGPCQVQCVKTAAFSHDAYREAQAHQARFLRQSLGIKPHLLKEPK